MKYTKEERNEIGRLVYTKKLTLDEASKKYKITRSTIKEYMHDYMASNNLGDNLDSLEDSQKEKRKSIPSQYRDLESLSREELIDELIKARVEAERAKRGYIVEEDYNKKEFINLSNNKSK